VVTPFSPAATGCRTAAYKACAQIHAGSEPLDQFVDLISPAVDPAGTDRIAPDQQRPPFVLAHDDHRDGLGRLQQRLHIGRRNRILHQGAETGRGFLPSLASVVLGVLRLVDLLIQRSQRRGIGLVSRQIDPPAIQPFQLIRDRIVLADGIGHFRIA
jgi:hypothetical protein